MNILALVVLIITLTALALLTTVRAASPHRRASTVGIASWYGDLYRGKLMANGQPFDPDRLTCATRDWPLNCRLLVRASRQWSGRAAYVVVLNTDRGPYVEGRLIDLSRAAFAQIADPDVGLVEVEVIKLP